MLLKWPLKKLLFKGTLNKSYIHPREIFKEAYLASAAYIICLHNHPSGYVLPSSDDIKVTDKLTTNHSYAKALCYVNKKGKFNGAGPSQLNRDNSLPLFDNGLNNQAYTYAIYIY